MKKLKSIFLLGALAIGLGLTSCSSDDGLANSQTSAEKGTTYMNLSFTFPTTTGTRAGTSSTNDDPAKDYNSNGTYNGNDNIRTIDVYVVNGFSIEFSKRYALSDTEYGKTDNSLTAKTAIKTTAGGKTVYVVINDPNALRSAPLYSQDKLSTNNLAKWTGDKQDDVTMTGSKDVNVVDGITQGVAISGTSNSFTIPVTRLASKAVVTYVTPSSDGTYPVGNGTTTIGKLSDVTYSVAQGETNIYAYTTPVYESVGFDFLPTDNTTYQSKAANHYDYSGLSNSKDLDMVSNGSYQGVQGTYLFENTHQYKAATTPADPSTSITTYDGGYRKGNTAYVLVRGTFTPDNTVIADGGTLTNGTFYVGAADSKIYSSAAAAQRAVTGQQYRTYTKGKVLYYAWLNPDNVTTPYNSPVIRNNVYQINITSFKTIGLNWNPLYPEDPNSTDPKNPDSKPKDPNEPGDTPIRPTDPLTVNETYMSVQVSVLPWNTHLYNVDLGL